MNAPIVATNLGPARAYSTYLIKGHIPMAVLVLPDGYEIEITLALLADCERDMVDVFIDQR